MMIFESIFLNKRNDLTPVFFKRFMQLILMNIFFTYSLSLETTAMIITTLKNPQ